MRSWKELQDAKKIIHDWEKEHGSTKRVDSEAARWRAVPTEVLNMWGTHWTKVEKAVELAHKHRQRVSLDEHVDKLSSARGSAMPKSAIGEIRTRARMSTQGLEAARLETAEHGFRLLEVWEEIVAVKGAVETGNEETADAVSAVVMKHIDTVLTPKLNTMSKQLKRWEKKAKEADSAQKAMVQTPRLATPPPPPLPSVIAPLTVQSTTRAQATPRPAAPRNPEQANWVTELKATLAFRRRDLGETPPEAAAMGSNDTGEECQRKLDFNAC
ncbi:hypothetical protein CYMTET_39629 [Cymbomonas tetramitiformis]|uniref:Uncharacterized protein n=1 Tax=Cymbomonas tetramitiformis TaxID=36881 RepID=A0AAE0F415_9CHLO|nr:hypothetical protein CYMTET_39629 [Cymbomonas tetramitiformis]|eukprot:gene10692-12645_t